MDLQPLHETLSEVLLPKHHTYLKIKIEPGISLEIQADHDSGLTQNDFITRVA